MTRFLLAIGFLTGTAFAAPTNEQLVRWVINGPSKPFEAQQKVALASGGRLVSSNVTVRGDGKGALLREYSLGTTTLALLQKDNRAWQKSDDEPWTEVSDGGGLSVGEAVKRTLANYRILARKQGILKGRPAIGFEIRPNLSGNPWREVWLESSSGVLLSEKIYSPSGAVRSSTQVSSVKITTQQSASFVAPSDAKSATLVGPTSFRGLSSKAEAERLAGRSVPLPSFVPKGYSVARYGVVKSNMGRTMPAVRYSDGLATFTIFHRFGFGPGGRFGRGRGQGGLQSDEQRSVVDHRSPSGSYLLIGDLSEELLVKVAQSLP